MGLDTGTFVALARLSPAHAHRVIMRLGPGLAEDYAGYRRAIGPEGQLSDAYLRRVCPGAVSDAAPAEFRAAILRDFRREMDGFAEIFQYAGLPVPD